MQSTFSTRSNPASFLSFLFVFTLILSLFPSVSPADEYDFSGSLGQYWNPADVFSGFCLPPSLRSISHFSQPLYSRPIRIGVTASSTFDHVMTSIAKILIQEVLGYPVQVYDPFTIMETWHTTMLGPQPLVDIFPNTAYTGASLNGIKLVQQNLVNRGLLTWYGSYEFYDQGLFFLSSRVAQQNPGYELLHWRAFSGGVESRPNTRKLAFPFSDVQMAKVRRNVELLRNKTWTQLQTYSNLLFDNGNPVCPPDSVFFPVARFRAGCNNALFPSLYIPPQCEQDPMGSCLLAFTYAPKYVGVYPQSIIRDLNLSIVLAFVQDSFFTQPAVLAGVQDMMIFGPTMGSYAMSACPVPGSPVSTACYNIVDLPDYDPSCSLTYTGSLESTQYYCTPPQIYRYRASRPDLKLIAPRVDELMKRLQWTFIDNQEFFQSLVSVGGGDFKRVACNWLLARANDTSSWKSWIAPPEPCSISDYSYTVGQCGTGADQFLISYAWKQPKACQGGVPLPQPEWINCGFYTASQSNHYTGMYSTVASFGVFPLAYFILFALQLAFGVSMSHAAMASRLLALVKQRSAADSNATPLSPVDRTGPQKDASVEQAIKQADQNDPILKLLALPKFIQFFLCLPVSELLLQRFTLIYMSQLVLSAVVWVNIDQLTESKCWWRISLISIGLTLLNLALSISVLKLKRSVARIIGKSNHEQRIMIGSCCILMVVIIVNIIASQDSLHLLQEDTYRLSTGATFSYVYCNQSQFNYTQFVVFAVNALPLIYSFPLLIQLMIKRVSQWIQEYFAAVQQHSGAGTASGASGSGSNSKGRRRLKSSSSHAFTTIQTIQLITLLLCDILFICIAVYLIGNIKVADDNIMQPNLVHINSIAESVMAFVIVLQFALYGPSLFHWCLSQYRKNARSKRKRSNSLPTLFGRTGSVRKIAPKTASDVENPPAAGGDGIGSTKRRSMRQNDETSMIDATSLTGRDLDSRWMSENNSSADADGTLNELRSLNHIIQDPLTCLLFEKYCESVYDAENIHFILHCARIMKSMKLNTANSLNCSVLFKISQQIQMIMDQFIVVNAPEQVNISSTLRQQIEHEYKQWKSRVDTLNSSNTNDEQSGRGNLNNHIQVQVQTQCPQLLSMARQLLLPAIKEVYTLIETNNYIRFLPSEQAQRASEFIVWSEMFYECTNEEQEALIQRFRKMKGRPEGEYTNIEASVSGNEAKSINPLERGILESETPLQTITVTQPKDRAGAPQRRMSFQNLLDTDDSHVDELNTSEGHRRTSSETGSIPSESGHPRRLSAHMSSIKYEEAMNRTTTTVDPARSTLTDEPVPNNIPSPMAKPEA